VSIFGHNVVHVEKDVERKRWVVSTAQEPRQVLVTIPWVDALKTFTDAQFRQYSDYIEALTTCQSNKNTALTSREVREIRAAQATTDTAGGAGGVTQKPTNVVSFEDFKRRKK